MVERRRWIRPEDRSRIQRIDTGAVVQILVVVDGKLSLLDCRRLSRGADRAGDGRACVEARHLDSRSARADRRGVSLTDARPAAGCRRSFGMLRGAGESGKGIDDRLTDVHGGALTSQPGSRDTPHGRNPSPERRRILDRERQCARGQKETDPRGRSERDAEQSSDGGQVAVEVPGPDERRIPETLEDHHGDSRVRRDPYQDEGGEG